MNKILLLPLLFFINSIIGQSYKITYEEVVSFTGDTTVERLASIMLKKREKHEQLSMTLLFSNGLSLYGSGDYLLEEENSNDFNASTTISLPKTYKSQSDKLIFEFYQNYEPNLYGKDILIKDKLPIYEWEITNETEVIEGFKCKLAKTTENNGTKVLAWFTDEIPINDGPRNLWGLPGLILQAQINERVLVAAVKIEELKKPIEIKLPKLNQAITPNEFKALKKHIWRPRTFTTPDGRTITTSPAE